MKASSLLLVCAILLGCNEDPSGKDMAPPGDLPAASETVSLPDSPAKLLDGPSADSRGQLDRPAQLDQPRGDLAKVPDLPKVPDKKPPDSKPPATCPTSWSLWSCNTGVNSCSATCSSYGMTCMQVGLTISCTCKHGTPEKSCKSSGQGCLMCSQGLLNGCCSGI